MNLQGKTAIITGASSGIGAAAALLFAANGANLVLGARGAERLNRIVGQINQSNGRAVALAGDVTDEGHARDMVQMAKAEFGGLDIAFNNAGTAGDMVQVPDMSTENWNLTLATNLTSAYYAARYQIPAMRERGGGSIVFTSSFVGHGVGFPGMAAYAAAKAGLIGLAQVLAAEHGREGIRVNALLPGGTRTAMAGDVLTNPETESFLGGLHALARIAEPEEIAQAALFLASDAASFVTGSAMTVDGGNSIFKV
jgi:NAD(P)-dependent dehydrogenase (short-subunit alcohol dehydrogenase family)